MTLPYIDWKVIADTTPRKVTGINNTQATMTIKKKAMTPQNP